MIPSLSNPSADFMTQEEQLMLSRMVVRAMQNPSWKTPDRQNFLHAAIPFILPEVDGVSILPTLLVGAVKTDTHLSDLIYQHHPDADPNAIDPFSGETAYTMAVTEGEDLDDFIHIWQKRLNANAPNQDGDTALTKALSVYPYCTVETLEILLDKVGTDPRLPGKDGILPLTLAEQNDHPRAVTLLQEYIDLANERLAA